MQLEVGHGSSVTTGYFSPFDQRLVSYASCVCVCGMCVSWTPPHIYVLSLPPDGLQNSPEFSDLTHLVSKCTNIVDPFLINKI